MATSILQEVSDPLADPRAADLLAALPDDVAALAANFHTAASESRGTAVGLSAARDDGTWTGRAAEAFRSAIGRLPAELEKVRAGFEAVADALTVYEGELARIQAAFARVVAELSDAQSRLGPAQATAHAAASALTTTSHARGASTRALVTAELAVARADGAVTGYTTEIAMLRRRAFDLLDEFSSARGACRTAIAAAENSAPVPRRTGHGTTVVAGGALIGRPRGVRPLGRAHRRDRAHRPVRLPHHPFGNVPPGQARERIGAMIEKANSLLATPYVWGGGHATWGTRAGVDCSGFVSAVLHAGGYLCSPQTTDGFAAQPGIAAGHGRYVTIYDRADCGADSHVIIDLNGRFYEAGGGTANGGAPRVHAFTPSAAYLASFETVLHPEGL